MSTIDLSNVKAITKAIDSVARRGKKLDDDIQDIALACINHCEQHGDITLIGRLYLSMPRGARKNALAAWAVEFGKVVPNGGDNKKEQPFLYDKDGATDMTGAVDKPWFEFKPEPAPADALDLKVALEALIKRATKEAGVIEGQGKLLAKLEQLAA